MASATGFLASAENCIVTATPRRAPRVRRAECLSFKPIGCLSFMVRVMPERSAVYPSRVRNGCPRPVNPGGHGDIMARSRAYVAYLKMKKVLILGVNGFIGHH